MAISSPNPISRNNNQNTYPTQFYERKQQKNGIWLLDHWKPSQKQLDGIDKEGNNPCLKLISINNRYFLKFREQDYYQFAYTEVLLYKNFKNFAIVNKWLSNYSNMQNHLKPKTTANW